MSKLNSESLDLSETDTSSSDPDEVASPALYENSPLILELHDLRKDSETPQHQAPLASSTEVNAAAPAAPETKAKRLRKKKKIPGGQQNRTSSGSSASPTESGGGTVPQSATEHTAKEQFYDARESLHTLPENQQVANPVVQAALAQAQSEHGPKMLPPAAAPQAGAQSATAGSRGRRPSNAGTPVTPVSKPTDTPTPE